MVRKLVLTPYAKAMPCFWQQVLSWSRTVLPPVFGTCTNTYMHAKQVSRSVGQQVICPIRQRGRLVGPGRFGRQPTSTRLLPYRTIMPCAKK